MAHEGILATFRDVFGCYELGEWTSMYWVEDLDAVNIF